MNGYWFKEILKSFLKTKSRIYIARYLTIPLNFHYLINGAIFYFLINFIFMNFLISVFKLTYKRSIIYEKIPFSLPYIDKSVINEVNDTLINTGWLTSGPKVNELENELQNIINSKHILCVNSWTSGAQLILRWLGVGPGDEVIIPAYTYSATALCIMNLGAKPIMVDVRNDFTIDQIWY